MFNVVSRINSIGSRVLNDHQIKDYIEAKYGDMIFFIQRFNGWTKEKC